MVTNRKPYKLLLFLVLMVDTSYLSKMRTSRGRDEAVGVIGDRKNLVNMLGNSGYHKREDFNKGIMSSYSGDSYGDSNWTKIYGAWGNRPEIVTIHGVFAEQNPGMEQLNLDHGLITRLPEFVEFMKENNSSDYSVARDSFNNHLGSQNMWRGMVLTKEEAERMRYEGIESDFLRKNRDNPLILENFESNVLSVYFDTLVEKHFHGENYQSPLISVSSHKDVATAVGRHFGGRALLDKEKDLYLFNMNIPKIDLIHYTDHAARLPFKLQDLVKNDLHIHISVDGVETSHPWDKNTESYVMYKINPEEIVEVLKPDVTESSWNGRVTK